MEEKLVLKKKKIIPTRMAPRPTSKKPVVKESIGLNNLRVPKGAHRRRRILGRGPSSGHGKTSTRGSKGQTSRSGRATYPGFEGGQMPLIRRIAKRGFTSLFRREYQIVNLTDLEKIKDTPVNPELLEKKGLIKDRNKPVKILGDGEIKNPITVQAHAFSRKAQDKIKNAGGSYEVLSA